MDIVTSHLVTVHTSAVLVYAHVHLVSGGDCALCAVTVHCMCVCAQVTVHCVHIHLVTVHTSAVLVYAHVHLVHTVHSHLHVVTVTSTST